MKSASLIVLIAAACAAAVSYVIAGPPWIGIVIGTALGLPAGAVAATRISIRCRAGRAGSSAGD
jgi:hypothetical protein